MTKFLGVSTNQFIMLRLLAQKTLLWLHFWPKLAFSVSFLPIYSDLFHLGYRFLVKVLCVHLHQIFVREKYRFLTNFAYSNQSWYQELSSLLRDYFQCLSLQNFHQEVQIWGRWVQFQDEMEKLVPKFAALQSYEFKFCYESTPSSVFLFLNLSLRLFWQEI